ncbi:MAG: 2-hydroxyacid dehydrogenase [Bdellovibrionia bacterium]
MKIALFDAHRFERKVFDRVNEYFHHDVIYFEPRLTPETAKLAAGFPVICAFANDRLNEDTLKILKTGDTQLIALRSAGFNHVDLAAAERLGLKVVRVPAYSPYAVAEHAVALLLALNRKICRANSRVRDLNFSLEGLVGFDLHEKKVGVIGTGRIGSVMATIIRGFGSDVLAFDPVPNPELKSIGVKYVSLEQLYLDADVISLHVPLTKSTRHMIDEKALGKMKSGVFLINTGRGALIDTKALIASLKSGHIGAAGLDVYEEEENVFFQDLSEQVLQDDILARLLTFPNVLITSHQGFLTQEALANIAETTLQNIEDFEKKRPLANEVKASK